MQFSKINILYKRLRDEGVDFFDREKMEPKDHWLCPEKWGLRKKRAFLVEVFSYLGVSKYTLDYFYPKRLCCCHDERCVNPDCFALSKKKRIAGEGSNGVMSAQDLEELADEIDMDEWRRLGTKNYLEQYNMMVPPFLRITEATLKKAIEWKKGELK